MRILALIMFVASLGLASCQKGEEDPVISLVTRKSRLAGKWTVKKYSAELGSEKREYDGSTLIVTIGDTNTTERPTTWEFDFDRQGTYVITETMEVNDGGVVGPYTITTTTTGQWEFTGGNNSPSKSKLLLQVTELKRIQSDQGSNIDITTYENPASGVIYDIIGLSSEDLKLEMDQTTSFGGGQVVLFESFTMKKN